MNFKDIAEEDVPLEERPPRDGTVNYGSVRNFDPPVQEDVVMKEESLMDHRTSPAKNTAASRPSLLRSAPATPLGPFQDPTAAQDIGQAFSISASIGAATWALNLDVTRQGLASVLLVSSGMLLPTPSSAIMPVHHDHVAPIPPSIQYPVVDRTAWYHNARNSSLRQIASEDSHPYFPQERCPSNSDSTLQHVAHQGCYDPAFEIARNTGGMHVTLDNRD